MKKLLSVLLIVALISTAIPFYTFAETALSGTIGNCSWKLEGTVLTISGEGEMGYGSPWGKDITKVIVEEGVTAIGEMAFYDCRQLKEIQLPESLLRIRDFAFFHCISLKEIDIPKNVYSVGNSQFLHCESLTSINVSDENPYFKDEEGVLFSIADNGAQTLIRYPIGKADVEYTVPSNTSGLRSASFYGVALEKVVIPASVEIISDTAFFECVNLKTVEFSEGLRIIRKDAFSGCTSLNEVTLPESVEELGDTVFFGCTNLSEVSFSGTPQIIGENLLGETAYYDNSENYADGVLYVGNCVISSKTNISGKVEVKEGTVTLADNAFINCEKITEVVLPQTVKYIGEGAFWECYGLEYINIPNGVEEIKDYTFIDCSSLKNVVLSETVEYIGKCAFIGCTSLTKVVIPNSVVEIGDNAFAECSGITNLVIGNGITQLGKYAFVDCSSLETISIPKTVLYIYDGTFNLCTNIIKIYYRGNYADKSRLWIGNNNYLDNAMWVYNSCIDGVVHFADETGKICSVCGAAIGVRGDLNGDEAVNTTDLALLKIFLAGNSELDDLGYYGADFNHDAAIDTTDLAQLKIYLAGE